MAVKASIVIRTLNNERTIRDVLEAVEFQSFRDYELVIVDSGSTDETLDIVRQYPHTLVDYSRKKFTYGGSLNAGCAVAEGEYIVSLSSHCIPLHAQWLDNLIDALDKDERLAGAYGQWIFDLENYPVGKNDGTEIVDLERFQQLPNRGLQNTHSIFRRELWERRPFSEEVRLEDQDWAHHFLQRGYNTARVYGAQSLYAIPNNPYWYAKKMMRASLALNELFGYDPGISTGELYRHSTKLLNKTFLGKKSPRTSSLSLSGMLGRWAADRVIWYRKFRA